MVGGGGEFCDVISDVSMAVTNEKVVIPSTIHMTAKILAGNERGDLSPYPTVVMEMKDHQIPSHQPIRKLRGNSCNGCSRGQI